MVLVNVDVVNYDFRQLFFPLDLMFTAMTFELSNGEDKRPQVTNLLYNFVKTRKRTFDVMTTQSI